MPHSAEIREIHLEVTENCNAACPQCPRRIEGGMINPKLTMAELTLAEVRNILAPDRLRLLKKIYLCGNYGDPAAAADTPEIVEYLRSASPALQIGIHTNGSLRSTQWWANLAGLIGQNGYARFAIDGLEDTNHIYRRNTHWDKIMANAAAYIAAGGRAEWDFIVFAHNEHQIDEARSLSLSMGFSAFHIKRTARFLKRETMEYAATAPVKDRVGTVVAQLARPRQEIYRNQALKALEEKRHHHTSYDDYLSQAQIRCKAARDKSLYVSAEGKLFPCCWIGGMLKNPESAETRQFSEIFPRVENGVSLAQVSTHWSGRNKLKICSRVCGS